MPKVPELPELYARVGANIRRCRIAAEMTQEALSLAVGLGRSSITNIECGRQRLQLDTLALIARELGVDAAELMIPVSADDFPVEVCFEIKNNANPRDSHCNCLSQATERIRALKEVD